MINGIIKLFYSEVVKNKMGKMASDNYELRDECKDIKNITLKIDSIFFKIIKFIFGLGILILGLNINIVFGIGILLVEIAYIIYKKKLEEHVKKSIYNIRNNIESTTVNLFSERGKNGINMLITLLIIGLLTSFNWIIIISFVTVFLFTIKDIYSNIK